MVVELWWKPEMEKGVEGLRTEVGKLRNQIQQMARNPAPTVRLVDLLGIFPKTEASPTTPIFQPLVSLVRDLTQSVATLASHCVTTADHARTPPLPL